MRRYFLIILLSIISSISCTDKLPPIVDPPSLYLLPLYSAVLADNTEEVKRLLLVIGENGGHKNGFGTIKNTLLVVRSLSMAKFLLSKGADVTVKYVTGETPLHKVYNVEIAKFLIDNGADVNARDRGGNTPLHEARNVAIAKFLIDNAADVNARNNLGSTPLSSAKRVDNQKLVTFLKEVMEKQEAVKP